MPLPAQAPAQEGNAPESPPVIAGYACTEPLGGGGFATVWEARDISGTGALAIKVGHVATDAARAHFAREADALARVEHRYAPALYDQGVLANGRPYLVMERLPGIALADYLGACAGPPELPVFHALLTALLDAVEAVHAAGLVHGDLKPENILVWPEPERALATGAALGAKVIDFGTAQVFAPGGSASAVIVGSVEYMAPEQLVGEPATVAMDIYAVGIMLYELLTLRVPFAGERASIERGHRTLRPPLPSKFASVPPALEQVCLLCLAKEPGKRPQSVADVRSLIAHAYRRGASRLPGASEPAAPEPASPALPALSAEPAALDTPLLTDAQQPVVILVAQELTRASRISHTIERYGGVIARQDGSRYICCYSGLDDDEPTQAALSAARELAERGTPVILHIAPLKIRRRSRRQPPKFYGRAVEACESWLPAAPWQGLVMTAAMAAALPDTSTRPAARHEGLYELVSESPQSGAHEPSLVGRDPILAAAAASVRAMIQSENPQLFTVYGDNGLGKSRLIRELSKLALSECPEAVVLSIRATRQTAQRSAGEIYHLIERWVDGGARAAMMTGRRAPTSSGSSSRPSGDGLRYAATKQPLIVLIDDLHYADGLTLDALEYATLDGQGVRLWLAVAAHPRLKRRRPQWGQRAYGHSEVVLEPLEQEAAMQLAAELLRPAEYPPAAVLLRLAHWAGGSPHALEELVRTLKREGIVRKRPHSDGWYVATAELDRLPASSAGQWLATRQLDRMPPELAACLRVCAVLGVEFSRDELEWVQNVADRTGSASTTMDTDIGLGELRQLGYIEAQGPGWSFRQAAFQDAVYKLIGSRERQRIHSHALAFWRRQAGAEPADRVLTAIARHAGASGDQVSAADAYVTLGDRAAARYRDVDADRFYTAALGYIEPGDDARRMHVLGERGRVRYRLQRLAESLADLRTAQAHAQAIGDTAGLARLLLEEATALDWAEEFQESARRADAARPLVEASPSPAVHVLRARLQNAQARSIDRAGDFKSAIALYEQAIPAAYAYGDTETAIIALLLLSTALVMMGEVERAKGRFEEVIELCDRSGDRLHLCAAYSNRVMLWALTKSLENALDDLREALSIVRELGHPVIESGVTYNLAELLYRSGRHEEALPLAHRSLALQRFSPEPRLALYPLLLARVCAVLSQQDQVRALLRQAYVLGEKAPMSPMDRLAAATLELVLADATAATAETWSELLREARESLPGAEYLEVLFFCARSHLRHGRDDLAQAALQEAGALLHDYPIWQESFSALSAMTSSSGAASR